MRFKAALELDLPSEQVVDRPGALSRIFGAKGTPTGEERVVGSTLAVIDWFARAFAAMGVDNVIALTVDQRPIYQDNSMVDDDMAQMAAALQANRKVLSEKFEFIHLVLEHDAAGIHYVIDTKVRGKVIQGSEEVYVVIAGKVAALNPGPQETARAYWNRLRQLLTMTGFLASSKLQFERKVDELRRQLAAGTGAVDSEVNFLEMGLVRPSRQSVQDLLSRPLRHQGVTFRDQGLGVDQVAYFHDPYSAFYRNPYDTLANLVIIGALLEGVAPGVPIDAVLYNFDGSALGIAAHLKAYRERLADIPGLASEPAAAWMDQDQPLSDPYMAQAAAYYGTPVGETGP